ncbi:hypothetical protein [Pseudaminobacter sp. NGMCC 1.201702]|uniref:hypothetical protein n=1 Tax=Pseudaminobacter sp. NGMCC 1.201702 TaxID=3391825 RepID=UPI0039EEA46C
MNAKWEKQTGQYQNGENYRVGRVIVGAAFYSGLVPRGDPKKYGCTCLLPGIKQAPEHYETIDEAKARLERLVSAWFEWVQS